jgi:hypothetical protein
MKPIKFLITTIFLLVILLNFVYAKGAGTQTGDFLNLGVDARAYGLGGAYTASSDGASSLYWNPAGLAYIQNKEANIMYTKWIDDINYQYILFGYPSKVGGLGIGIQRLSMGTILGKDDSGNSAPNFTPQDMVVMLGYGKKLDIGAVGITAKYINSKIQDSANTVSVDIGVRRELIKDKCYVGLTGSNLIGSLKYDKVSIGLGKVYRLGGEYKVNNEFTAMIDGKYSEKFDVACGAEYTYKENYSLRIGYGTDKKDMDALGLSFGFGVKVNKFTIDYAYAPLGILTDAHYISLGYSF